MLRTSVKKLIIVTGEKEAVYAELLSALISLKDDDIEKDRIVGIEDNSAEAVIWNENIYSDNKAQLGSNTKIIFVGRIKSSENIVPSIHFDKEKEKYGVKVGWLSNKAVIYIEPNNLLGNKKLYEAFYREYIKTADRIDDRIADSASIKKAKPTDGIDTAFDKGARAVGGFIGGLFGSKPDSNVDMNTDFFDFGAKIEAGSLIPDQLFRFAILDFYLNQLSEFLGSDHE